MTSKTEKEIIQSIDDTIKDMHQQEKLLLEAKRILLGKSKRRGKSKRKLKLTVPQKDGKAIASALAEVPPSTVAELSQENTDA